MVTLSLPCLLGGGTLALILAFYVGFAVGSGAEEERRAGLDAEDCEG